MIKIVQLHVSDLKKIKELFYSVFSLPPWNDDWSDEEQLNAYLLDLIDNKNSLAFGFYDNDELIGISLGHIKHWYQGTEYFIDELCIKTEKQGLGYGAQFIELLEKELKTRKVKNIFLLTDRNVPAYEFYKKRGFYELTENVAFCKEI